MVVKEKYIPTANNARRANWAEQAIETFEYATSCDREDALADLICDLMHWAEYNELDFDREFNRALNHFEVEKTGKEL